ncbi:ATP-binding cassette domain-containing protein [Rhodococcoides kyotonense]|nr:ABC transporter ATP-binding protein [Rhodococcus kyotonensis]
MTWTFVVAAVSLISLSALSALASLAVGIAVVNRTAPPSGIWWALAGLVALRALLTWHEMDVSHSLAYRVLHRLRMALFSAAASRRDRDHSARRTTIAMADTEKLEFFYAHTVAQLAAAAVAAIAAVSATATISVPAAAASLVGIVALIGSARWGSQAAAHAADDRAGRLDTLSIEVADALVGRREVIVFGLADRLRDDARRLTDLAGIAEQGVSWFLARAAGSREFIVTATVAATVLAVSYEGRIAPAVAPAAIVLALSAATAIDSATATFGQIAPLAASARRITDGAVVSPEVPRASSLPAGALGIEWTDLDVDYGRGPTLGGHSESVSPGEHVAIAGRSGTGKSTLVAVLARLVEPTSGGVRVHGDGKTVRLQDIHESDLRSGVAVVAQEPTLFHGTIRSNLTLGCPNSDDHLNAVLHSVGADEFVTLDTPVGEDGARLSGGQIARVALARALARRPRLLLVDELTAALDSDSEGAVLDALDAFEGTVICVSHRRSTLKHFPRALTLGD